MTDDPVVFVVIHTPFEGFWVATRLVRWRRDPALGHIERHPEDYITEDGEKIALCWAMEAIRDFIDGDRSHTPPGMSAALRRDLVLPFPPVPMGEPSDRKLGRVKLKGETL